jgi:hypothetical protein
MIKNTRKDRERVWNARLIHGDPAQEPFVLCNLCRMPVDPGEAWDISHIGVPAAHDGQTVGIAHRACNHADNHVNVIPFVAKTKRMYRNHHGIDEPGLTPQALPFGRKSKLRKKLNGEIVPRRSGNQQHHDLMARMQPGDWE